MTSPRRSDHPMGSMSRCSPVTRRRWRNYKTPSGRNPVEEFIDRLFGPDKATVLAGMEDVRERGLRAARHLDGDIWEVRTDGDRVIYRILFATEGRWGQVLLALEVLTRRPEDARPRSSWRESRLAEWRGGEEINCVLRAMGVGGLEEIRGGSDE